LENLATTFGERMKNVLDGKVAVVTGAGRGCGRAIAVGLARAGAKVCCIARSGDEIESAVAEIKKNGGQGIAQRADVSDLDSVNNAFAQTAQTFGGIDIVVLSHGVAGGLGPVDQGDPAEWKRTVEINLIGTYHSARAAIPHLKGRGAGKIIVVGSGQGHQGTASTSAYACSKAGTWALVQSLSAELVSFNISVNELLPGNVKTKLYDQTFQQVVAMTPKSGASLSEKRSHEWLKDPEDVVPLALFMACQPDVGPTAQSFSLMRRF
jgi:3-oxoacyl-[acyl-carrier protein] reductase